MPLNVKIDVLNYYDLSRKLNLDPALAGLNSSGFAVIDNPWVKEAPDFYSIYSNLEEKQIPFLITSDFIIYYYQTVLKKAFKDIEENIFYDNLWSINKDLYNSGKLQTEISDLKHELRLKESQIDAWWVSFRYSPVALFIYSVLCMWAGVIVGQYSGRLVGVLCLAMVGIYIIGIMLIRLHEKQSR